MATEYNLKDIVAKIAKLREVARRAGTPEEAAVFAEKVQSMLLKYNLAETELDSFRPDDLSAFINDEGLPVGGRWRPMLLIEVARSSFVEMVVDWKRDKKGNRFYRMIGRPENVEVAKETYLWLIEQISDMASKGFKDAYTDMGRTAWMNAFKNGAAEIVSRRLAMQRMEQERVVEQSKALMVVNDQSKAALAKFYPQVGKSKALGGKERYGEAYETGRRAGADVNLSRNKRLS